MKAAGIIIIVFIKAKIKYYSFVYVIKRNVSLLFPLFTGNLTDFMHPLWPVSTVLPSLSLSFSACLIAGGADFKSPEQFKLSLPLRTNYLYGRIITSLPEMYAFTLCMWIKSSASPGIGTPFSYGVPGQANEIVLIEWGNNPIELLINDKASSFWIKVTFFFFFLPQINGRFLYGAFSFHNHHGTKTTAK